MRGLVILLMLAAPAAQAAGPCDAIVGNCMDHACSNDALPDPVMGDEIMCWDAPQTTVPITEYRVMLGPETCAILPRLWSARAQAWRPPVTHWRPYASANPACWPLLDWMNVYSVMACNCSTRDAPCGCSADNPTFVFKGMPYTCFGGSCP